MGQSVEDYPIVASVQMTSQFISPVALSAFPVLFSGALRKPLITRQ